MNRKPWSKEVENSLIGRIEKARALIHSAWCRSEAMKLRASTMDCMNQAERALWTALCCISREENTNQLAHHDYLGKPCDIGRFHAELKEAQNEATFSISEAGEIYPKKHAIFAHLRRSVRKLVRIRHIILPGVSA